MRPSRSILFGAVLTSTLLLALLGSGCEIERRIGLRVNVANCPVEAMSIEGSLEQLGAVGPGGTETILEFWDFSIFLGGMTVISELNQSLPGEIMGDNAHDFGDGPCRLTLWVSVDGPDGVHLCEATAMADCREFRANDEDILMALEFVSCPPGGNGMCENGENELICPDDCVAACGDGVCDMSVGETSWNCSFDCLCGDTICDDNESASSSCPQDCGGCVGGPNGFCDVCSGEFADPTPVAGLGSCGDCSSNCFDGVCQIDLGENWTSCPSDCGSCGDGLCGPSWTGETFMNCPSDCPDMCGDGTCDPNQGETVLSCPADCQGECGDGMCEVSDGENRIICPSDCGGASPVGDGLCDRCNGAESEMTSQDCAGTPSFEYCGNGVCVPAEVGICTDDCVCGNGVCDPGEDPGNCSTDCNCGDGICQPPFEDPIGCGDCVCGDGICQSPPEDAVGCPMDCWCGDGLCGVGEDPMNCLMDCFCGNGLCEPPWEDAAGCLLDCICGDGICSPPENNGSCSMDCSCGDGYCWTPGENNTSCPGDCFCGDGTCQPGFEDNSNCPADCP